MLTVYNKEFNVEIQRADKGAGVKRARYFKQDKEGVATMCKMMEDMRNEAAKEAAQKALLDSAKEKAMKMIKNGKISIDEVSEYFPELSENDVKKIEAEVMQLV